MKTRLLLSISIVGAAFGCGNADGTSKADGAVIGDPNCVETRSCAPAGGDGAVPELDGSIEPGGDAAVPGPDAEVAAPDAQVPDADAPLSGFCPGDYYLETAEDLARISNCTEIGGAVYSSSGFIHVSLPVLEVVQSSLQTQAFASLSAPALREIGGNLQLDSNVSTVDLPSLTTIGGQLYIVVPDELMSLSLPELTTIGGTLIIDDTYVLTGVSLPKLLTIGGALAVTDNDVALKLAMPLLQSVRSELDLSNNAEVEGLSLPALTSVGGSAGLDLGFNVVNNPKLTNLDLPLLTSVGQRFVVQDNPKLPVSDAQSIRMQLVDFSGPVTISGNLP